jgi:hydroxymethylpyrimidine/phosphomethylpyrimidine kinase
VKVVIKYDRPIVWSVAGYDPTGGAGVLADVKTFEQNNVLGMAFLSATTIQKENEFIAVNWNSAEEIFAQIIPVAEDYQVSAVKIGIVESLQTLFELVSFFRSTYPTVKIVWDPVLSASSGFELTEANLSLELKEVLGMITLITPNVHEARRLIGCDDEIEAAFQLAEFCPVLLKGGHSSIRLGVDLLIENRVPHEIIGNPEIVAYSPKHGSGCILSAAIASNLALGYDLTESCRNAKIYIEKRLKSNENLLAYHVE